MTASAAGVEVEVIVTADLTIPEAYVFPGGNPVARLAGLVVPRGNVLHSKCLAYVVRHPSAGTILIDTGMHPDAASDLRRDFGLAMSIVFRGLRPAAEPFDRQLRDLGVEPGEVGRVIMTHLHVDHTGGMRLLPEATFTCSGAEWSAATQPRAAGKGYIGHHLPPAERVDLVDFERDGERHGPFERTIDLLGDGSIRLVSTPGHTVGHMSVLLRVGGGGGEVLVVGDAAYTLRSIREQVAPLLTAGAGSYARSLRSLGAYVDDHSRATVVPTHDPDAWRALRGAPAAAAS